MKRAAFPLLHDTGRGLELQDPGMTKLEYISTHMMLVLLPLKAERPYEHIAEHAVTAAKALLNELEKHK